MGPGLETAHGMVGEDLEKEAEKYGQWELCGRGRASQTATSRSSTCFLPVIKSTKTSELRFTLVDLQPPPSQTFAVCTILSVSLLSSPLPSFVLLLLLLCLLHGRQHLVVTFATARCSSSSWEYNEEQESTVSASSLV
jgi:hypothetical protein